MNTVLIRTIVILILITISFVISKSRSKIACISYMIITSILMLFGWERTWMLTRELNMELLHYHLEGRIDYEFMVWAFQKYKTFAVISLIATTIILFIWSLSNFFKELNQGKKLYWIVYLVFGYRIIIILFSIIYSYSTINKHFSLVDYILEFAIAQCLIIYLPLILRKRWYDKVFMKEID